MAICTLLGHADIGAIAERVGQSKPFGSFFSYEASRFDKLTNKMPTLPQQVRLLVGRQLGVINHRVIQQPTNQTDPNPPVALLVAIDERLFDQHRELLIECSGRNQAWGASAGEEPRDYNVSDVIKDVRGTVIDEAVLSTIDSS